MSEYRIRALGDLLLAAVVVGGSVILFAGAAELPPPRFEPLGSAAMPRILGVILCLLAAIVAVQAVLRLARGEASDMPNLPPLPELDTDDGTAPGKASPIRGIVVLGAVLAYVGALDILKVDFTLATTCFVAVTGMAMTRPGPRELLLHAALGLLLGLGVSAVFATFLHVEIG